MFKGALLLIAVCLLCTAGFAQQKTAKQLAVEKVLVTIFDGLSNRDMAAIRANCTPDFLLLEGGLVWNLDTLQQKVEQMKAVKNYKRVNSFDFFNTVVRGKVAWTNYWNTAVITAGDKTTEIHWLESGLFEKRRGVWKLKTAQSNLVSKSSK